MPNVSMDERRGEERRVETHGELTTPSQLQREPLVKVFVYKFGLSPPPLCSLSLLCLLQQMLHIFEIMAISLAPPCSFAKSVFPLLPVIMLTFVGLGGTSKEASAVVQFGLFPSPASDFCSRTLAAKSCPTPPTVDSLQINDYLGVFYMIGSTARYKFKSETGLICIQANYSYGPPAAATAGSDSATTISVLNSGVEVVGSQTISAVNKISDAASNICSKARRICSMQAPNNRISQALALISVVRSRISPNNPVGANLLREVEVSITVSSRIVNVHLDSIARGVNQIQLVIGQVNQGVGPVNNGLETVQDAVEKATTESRSIGSVAIGNLSMSRNKLSELADSLAGSDAQFLKQATSLIEAEVHQITDDLSKIDGQLTSIGGPLATMISADQSATSKGLTNLKTTRAEVIQSDPKQGGKLQLVLEKVSVPYQIIALDGDPREGYRAALVYSCTMQSDGEPNADLYLLSRTPKIAHETVDHFLATARGYGISTDCDSPFITTVQRGGDCGAP